MQIVHCLVELVCRFFVGRLEINVFNISLIGFIDQYIVNRFDERAMVSNLSMNRMVRMPEMLESR